MTAWRMAAGLPRMTRATLASRAATSSAGLVTRSRGMAVLISAGLYHRGPLGSGLGCAARVGVGRGAGNPKSMFLCGKNH